MRKFQITTIFFLLILLMSCANKYQAAPVKDVNGCKQVCLLQAKSCVKTCENSCYNCSIKANHSALKSYKKYLNEQCIKGGVVARELNSYRDPLQCRKTTCNCQADYMVCTQYCTGKIQKQLQVPSSCC